MKSLASFHGLTLHHHQGISLGHLAGSSKSILGGNLIHGAFHTFLSTQPAGLARHSADVVTQKLPFSCAQTCPKRALNERRSSLARQGQVLHSAEHSALPQAPARAWRCSVSTSAPGACREPHGPANSTSEPHPSGNNTGRMAGLPAAASSGLSVSCGRRSVFLPLHAGDADYLGGRRQGRGSPGLPAGSAEEPAPALAGSREPDQPHSRARDAL